jgi:hypothetical protein
VNVLQHKIESISLGYLLEFKSIEIVAVYGDFKLKDLFRCLRNLGWRLDFVVNELSIGGIISRTVLGLESLHPIV